MKDVMWNTVRFGLFMGKRKPARYGKYLAGYCYWKKKLFSTYFLINLATFSPLAVTTLMV